MNDISREEAERAIDDLPEWVAPYLSCWGSKLPDGGRMTVTFAAEFAGVKPATVRKLRERSDHFSRLEDIARHATIEWAQTYVEAGLRAMAPDMMRALRRLIRSDDSKTVLKAMEWLLNRPQRMEIEVDESDIDAEIERELARLAGRGEEDVPGGAEGASDA
jgi:hypothetical protein